MKLKELLSILFIFILPVPAYSQFAEIYNPENLAIKPKWRNECPKCPKLMTNGDMIYAISPGIGLYKIIFPRFSCRGSIPDSSYRIIENEFPELKRTKVSKRLVEFKSDSIEIELKIRRYRYLIDHSKIHQENEPYENCYSEFAGNIQRKKWMYQSVKVKIGTKILYLPEEAFSNFFQPNIDYCKCYFNHQESKLYIIGFDGDGGETTHFVWMIRDGIYVNRAICGGN